MTASVVQYQDVSAEIAGQIGAAKTAGASENIRCGRYRVMISSISADKVATDKGDHKFAFVEIIPMESKPNPQSIGNIDANGKLLDDGNNPNPVGSPCAMKVDFDGAGARSAGGNIKAFVLALFNKRSGEITDADVSSTWIDLARQRPLRKGDAIGIGPDNRPILYEGKDKAANPARGMLIDLVAFAKKKKDVTGKTPDQWYVTKLIWSNVAVPGQGENAPDKVAERLAQVEDEDEDGGSVAVPPPAAASTSASTANGASIAAAGGQQVAPPPPAAAAPPPPAAWEPKAPWVRHPDAEYAKQGWCWSSTKLGGDNSVKSEQQLRAMGL